MREYDAISSRDRLIDSLWLDARREASQELQQAQAEADRLMEESRLFGEQQMALASETAEEEAMPNVSRILNQAYNRARQLVLDGRYAFLESCFDEVLETIQHDNSFRKNARAALPHLLRQVVNVLEGREDIKILLNPDDRESARLILEEMKIKPDLVPDKNISGGVMLRTRDGAIIVDNTIEGRLGVLREASPIELLKLIGPNEGDKRPFKKIKTSCGSHGGGTGG